MAGWKQYTLGDLCKFKYGQMPRESDLCEYGYPVFSGYRIVGYANAYHYEDPEIIIVARGVGGTGDVKMSPHKCFLTNLSIVALVVSSEVDKKFLYYRLAGPKLWELRTGSAQAQITIDRLQGYELKLPPLPTQRKIAGILSAYDGLIENNTRRIKILEEMAQRIYYEWFVHFRFPGHEKVRMVESEMGMIPEGWQVIELKEFGEILTGKTPSKTRPEYYGNDVPFIKTPDMHSNMFCIITGEYLSLLGAESQSTKTLPPNSLCVSCIGTVGVVSITAVPAQTNQQINSIKLKEDFFREFIYFALIDLKELIELHGSTGATMTNLSKGKFETLEVITPYKNLLVSYHDITKSIFDAIKNLQYKNLNLRQTRDLLLPKLISGQLDVSDLDIDTGALDA